MKSACKQQRIGLWQFLHTDENKSIVMRGLTTKVRLRFGITPLRAIMIQHFIASIV